MANLAREPNPLGKAIADAIDKAEATEIRKSASEIRKALAAVEKRQETDEDAILKVVRMIGERLGTIERAIGPAALEAASRPDDPMRIAAKYAPGPYERGAMSMSRR